MALQLLKRNYAGLGGYECPKILKNPQGESRSSRKSPNVDVGEIMMQIRMDNTKNKYIAEHVRKYDSRNPYGEGFNEVYKVNKQFRPPIIDPKFNASLSRMPVKFDSVTIGPIVKDLYGKQIAIGKVAPKTIIDRVCSEGPTNPSLNIQPENVCSRDKKIMHNKINVSIPYHPSIPVYQHINSTLELDPAFIVRPNMGIHAPFTVSDQSRDVNNMRTPTHVAVQPGYKVPGTVIPLNQGVVRHQQTENITPKVQTSAWYNPSYFLTENSGFGIGNGSCGVPVKTRDTTPIAGQTNVSWTAQEADRGITKLMPTINAGSFEGKPTMPNTGYSTQNMNNYVREITPIESFTVINEPADYTTSVNSFSEKVYNSKAIRNEQLNLQQPRSNITERTFHARA